MQVRTDDGQDRFDEFAMGVKKKFRPDWLASENQMFINKLNYVVKHFDEDHKSVSTIHPTVLNVNAHFDFLM